MKTAISIPDDLFSSADRLAKRLHMSRSELYSRAVAEYVAEHRSACVRERLDEVYGAAPTSMEPSLLDAQAASLPDEDW
jgi:antitoxin MazE6